MTHPLASRAYAAVFEAHGEPLWTPPWGCSVLVRPIPGTDARDAVGIYPLTVFGADADLHGGLEWLGDRGLVSVSLVPEPLCAPSLQGLAAAFPLCIPFKLHHVVDYSKPVRFTKHHRYEVKRALRHVEVAELALGAALKDWTGLYAQLSERHDVRGLAQLDPAAFERLSGVQGVRALAAAADGEIVSMHLWLDDPQSGTVQSLFAGSSARGYALSAPYAVYDLAVRLFSERRALNLGGAAGLSAGADDGLARFKSGFANTTVQAHFCAAVLDEARYGSLTGASPLAVPFPAYRSAPAASEKPARLRPLGEADLAQLHAWYQSPSLWEHLAGSLTPRSADEAIAYMRRWLDSTGPDVRLAIEAGGELVGLVALSPVDLPRGVAEFHIFLGDPAARGRGVGRAATAAMLDHAFDVIGLKRVELKVLETNTAARRTYEACGFSVVGPAGEALKAGRAVPLVGLAIERDQPRSATT